MRAELEKIKNMEYTGVKESEKMSKEMRAAHFSSFSAVVGYKELVEKKGKLQKNN